MYSLINLGTDWYWYASSSHFFNYNAWNRCSFRGAFRTLSNIYDWGFLQKWFQLLPFNSNISSIIENWHGSKYASQPQRFYSRVFDIMIKMKLEHFLTQRPNWTTKSTAAVTNSTLRAWFFSSVLWAKGERVVF